MVQLHVDALTHIHAAAQNRACSNSERAWLLGLSERAKVREARCPQSTLHHAQVPVRAAEVVQHEHAVGGHEPREVLEERAAEERGWHGSTCTVTQRVCTAASL